MESTNSELLKAAFVTPERAEKIGRAFGIIIKAHMETPSLIRMSLEHSQKNPDKSFSECVEAAAPECRRLRHEAIDKALNAVDSLLL